MAKQSFRGKATLVSGASRGIGKAIAIRLAQLGSRLVLVSRSETRLNEVAGRIGSFGGETLIFPADVIDPDRKKDCVEKTVQKWGTVDILVSNAGEYIRSPIKDLAMSDIVRSMEVNFYAGVYFAQAVLPVMQAQGRGHMVFITSMDGKKGLPMDAPYVSEKFPLTGFVEVLRQELH